MPGRFVSIAGIAIWLLLNSSAAFAQVHLGASIGGYKVNLSGDTPKDATYKGLTTLAGSVVLEYGFTRDVRLSIQPGFERKGTTIAFDVPGIEDEVRDSVSIDLDYISLPILARVVTDGGRWFVTGGPVLGFLSDATGTYADDGREVELTTSFRSHDLGLAFGVGHFFPVGALDLFFEVRFIQGLMNVSDLDNSDFRVRNGGQQLLFGTLYRFGS
jgi:hypothetical protein